MSTADNKVKLQLRPNLTSPGPSLINRTDKNPSPSKLMINHGKPNYTINRTTSSPKNKPVTTDLPTSSCLTLPLKPSSCSSQMERVVLKHVESSNISSPSTLVGQKPPAPAPAPSSFVSPGISSKAAATSFGVKLKQCNKKNFQNDDGVTNSIMHNCNIQNVEDEPEFVRRQKQIFEKLQQKEQHQLDITTTRYNSHQNGHSEKCISPRSDQYDSKEIINISQLKPVNSRLENVSSDQVVNNINNLNQQNQPPNSIICKLPQVAISGKPVIPGKPPNLQIPSGRIMINQQNNFMRSKSNLMNNVNKTPNTVTNITTVSKAAEEPQENIETSINNKTVLVLENSSGTNIVKETIESLPNELATELNISSDKGEVKVIKTLSNGNGIINYEDEDDDGLKEFIEIEHSAKLAESVVQLKFDTKTDEQEVSVSSDVSMK